MHSHRLRGHLTPFHDVEITDDMRAMALARTNDMLGKLDELRKRRELPIEMLPLIAEVFSAEMQALHVTEAMKRQAEEDVKREAEFAKYQVGHSHAHHNLVSSELDGLGAAFARQGVPVRSHVPSARLELETKRETLPINSVAYLCSKCKVNHSESARGSVSVPYKIKPGERMRVTARPQRVAFRPEEFTIEHAEHWMVHDFSIGNRSQFAQAGDVTGTAMASLKIHCETAQTAMDVEFDVTYRGPEKDGEQFLATVTGTAAY